MLVVLFVFCNDTKHFFLFFKSKSAPNLISWITTTTTTTTTCEKRDKYLDLAIELKKLWNKKVTIIPIVIGAFGTVANGLLKGLEDLKVGGRVETIQTTALLKTARILRRVLETWGDLLSLNLQWKTIS